MSLRLVIKGMRSFLFLCALSLIVVGLNGCNRNVDDNVVLSRILSPDKRFEVVVTEVRAGATVSAPFEVFLVGAGKELAKQDLILKIDKSERPTVEWQSPNLVSISCAGGRIWYFKNFWIVRTEGENFVDVGVSLSCGNHGYRGS